MTIKWASNPPSYRNSDEFELTSLRQSILELPIQRNPPSLATSPSSITSSSYAASPSRTSSHGVCFPILECNNANAIFSLAFDTMAYTLERYELARRLFPKSLKEDLGKKEIWALAEPYYQLRERKGETLLTWVDDEKDGDYNPKEDGAPKKRKSLPGASRAAPVAKRARSSSLTPDFDSMPEPENEKEVDPWDTYWAVEPSSEDTPYKLRTRKRMRDAEERAATGTYKDTSTDSDSDGEELTSEGCLACQELELPCSSVEDPSSYPCQTCRDDGLDCELFPAPKLKRACERCRQERGGGPCSYLLADYDHSLPCRACLEHGFQCLAGPLMPRSKAGTSTDTDVYTDTETDTEIGPGIESTGESWGGESDGPSAVEPTGYSSSSDSECGD